MQLVVLMIGALIFVWFAVEPDKGSMFFRPEDRVLAAQQAEYPQLVELQARFERASAERQRLGLQIAALPSHPAAADPLVLEYQGVIKAATQARREAMGLVQGKSRGSDTNYIFPYFLLNHIPMVLLGLIVAAIFAAAMSSADSALNSLTSSTVIDLHRRWLRPKSSEAQLMRVSRWYTLFWGVSASGSALLFEGGGSVIEMINMVGSLFYGSLLGVFLLALCCKPAREFAGVIGLVASMVAVLTVHFAVEIEFLWYNLIGAVVCVVAGVTWVVSVRVFLNGSR
jgi:Na+(H+)/acetate symporter ActP